MSNFSMINIDSNSDKTKHIEICINLIGVGCGGSGCTIGVCDVEGVKASVALYGGSGALAV